MSEQPATYETGAEFKREDRYFVFKRSDHTPDAIKNLEEMARTRDVLRALKGKPPLVCVVVEKDWPEYETVWKMIEDRVTGQPSLLSKIAAGMGRTHSGDD